MSVEIWLYTDSGSKHTLRQHLLEHGFVPSRSRLVSLPGYSYFYWFDGDDFRSTVGVEASVYLASLETEGNEIWSRLGAQCWVLHTRTRASASTYDRTKQNEMIREARRKFGGKFYNDWHGWNRYTPIPPETHTPAERGIISIYNFLELKLAAIPTVLPKPYIVAPEGNKNLATLLREIDPSTYLYNAMLPYAIAAIEYFFSQVFIVMIRYDARAQSKIAKENRRIYMEDVLGISRGEKTIEDLVAGWYSFQSLDGIHRAFADWLDIDFWAMMRKRKRIRNRTIILSDALRELIKMRHELIHRFEFDYELDRERLIYIFGVVEEVIKTFLRELEASHGMRLSDEINV